MNKGNYLDEVVEEDAVDVAGSCGGDGVRERSVSSAESRGGGGVIFGGEP